MTNEDIIRMAKEAWGENHEIFWFDDDGIERFAALVRADEREACAKVCEELKLSRNTDWEIGTLDCATAIRARGEE